MGDYVRIKNLNLMLLMAIRLGKSWNAGLNFISVVAQESGVVRARDDINELRDVCRIGSGATTRVMVGDFDACVRQAPQSDMDVMGLKSGPDFQFVEAMVQATRSSCMFAVDSGLESALA